MRTDLANSKEGLHVLPIQFEDTSTVAEGQLRLSLSETAEREVEVELLERSSPDDLLVLVSQSHCLQLPHRLWEGR